MHKLEKFTIKNFKSIREQTLEIGSLNIFIGGNGSGKSNLIEVFRFLREIVNQNLAGYTILKGGADTLLYFGRKQSKKWKYILSWERVEYLTLIKLKSEGQMRIVLLYGKRQPFIMRKINIQNHMTGQYPRFLKDRNLNRKDTYVLVKQCKILIAIAYITSMTQVQSSSKKHLRCCR